MQARELSGAAAAASVVWALLPLLTFGLATPLAFGYAAFRRWSGWLWAAAAMYAVIVGSLLALTAAYLDAPRTPAAVTWAVGGGMLAVMLAGTVHAFWIRRLVFNPPR